MSINKNIPVTNREKYLAKIAGEEVSASNPINREDYFLNEISEKEEGSGGSGGGSEPMVVTMTWVQDMTWYMSEVTAESAISAISAGTPVIIKFVGGTYDGINSLATSFNSSGNISIVLITSFSALEVDSETGYIYKYLGD